MKILSIAHNTFRENVRDKIFYNLILFGFLLIASSLILGELSIGQEIKIIVDLGLTSISVVGGLIAIFIGIGLVHKEIDRRTIYSIVSKPVQRHEFLLGKFLGLLLTLAVNVSVMTLGVYAALVYLTQGWQSDFLNLLPAVVLIYTELTLLTSVALFFSTFSTPTLSASFALALWCAGHFNADLRRLASLAESEALDFLCSFLYYVVPNFANFDTLKDRNVIQVAGYFNAFDPGEVVMVVLYGVMYATVTLAGAILVFERRDFK